MRWIPAKSLPKMKHPTITQKHGNSLHKRIKPPQNGAGIIKLPLPPPTIALQPGVPQINGRLIQRISIGLAIPQNIML